MHALRRLLRVEQIGVDRLEERRVQLHRLRDHLTVGQQARTDHLDLRQRRGGVEDPERRVVEVAARDEPLVGLVDRRQRARRRAEELHLRVALADLAQPGAEIGDRLIVRVEQPPFGQERVHERVADRAFDRLAELRARHEERVDVDPVRVQRQVRRSTFLSSIVTSTRSMSDFAQTVSCDRLPQRIAARTERSRFTCSTSASSASVNFCWIDSFPNRRGQARRPCT